MQKYCELNKIQTRKNEIDVEQKYIKRHKMHLQYRLWLWTTREHLKMLQAVIKNTEHVVTDETCLLRVKIDCTRDNVMRVNITYLLT